MYQTNMSVIAVTSLDESIFMKLIARSISTWGDDKHNFGYDARGIKAPDNRYILNAKEYSTQEGFHLTTIGYSMDKSVPGMEIRRIIDNGLENGAIIKLNHPYVDMVNTKTAGHIPEEREKILRDICTEYRKDLTIEWNAYCIPWVRKGLQHVLNSKDVETKYHDVNKKAELLADVYKMPLISNTDLKARTKRHLNYMGRARMVMTKLEGSDPKEIFDSLKENIFANNYTLKKEEVGFLHFCSTYGMKKLFSKS